MRRIIAGCAPGIIYRFIGMKRLTTAAGAVNLAASIETG